MYPKGMVGSTSRPWTSVEDSVGGGGPVDPYLNLGGDIPDPLLPSSPPHRSPLVNVLHRTSPHSNVVVTSETHTDRVVWTSRGAHCDVWD